MRAVVIGIVIVSVCSLVNAQFSQCYGYNMTLNIRDTTTSMCPYGFVPDLNQGRCLTYRQLVNNFLNAPCNLNSDCGPLAINPFFGGGQIFSCGVKKVCTWSQTRMVGDPCSVNTNCYSGACSKSNFTCVPGLTTVTTAGYLDRCNYIDYSNYITCQPQYYCQQTNPNIPGNCQPLLNYGQTCGINIPTQCITGAICYNNTCSTLRTLGQTCSMTSQCSQSQGAAYCNSATGVCMAYQPAGAGCNYTYLCTSGTNCVFSPTTQQGTCMNPSGNNGTCGNYPYTNVCQAGLTCVNGYCSGNNYGNPCTATGIVDVDTCIKPNLLCVNGFCVNKVGIGGNCTYSPAYCLPGLLCYNNTCIAPQTAGQPCDPTGFINPLQPLFCNASLQCSRGICIQSYSLSLGSYCAQSSDCDSSYCDPMLSICTRRQLCSTSTPTCTCVCNGGLQNLGQCIMDTCNKQRNDLVNCLNGLGYTITTNQLAANDAWLDSVSSYYTKCQAQHSAFVTCEATMSKWGAPSMPQGDVINYDLSGISSATTLTSSMMIIFAIIVSALLLL
jgi:hypothetical protein